MLTFPITLLLTLSSEVNMLNAQHFLRAVAFLFLCRCLDGGANSKATQYATWALANMLADNPAAQVLAASTYTIHPSLSRVAYLESCLQTSHIHKLAQGAGHSAGGSAFTPVSHLKHLFTGSGAKT